MKYLVRDCDPNTGEPDDDGYDDEYVVRYNEQVVRRVSPESRHRSKNHLPRLCLSWRIWR